MPSPIEIACPRCGAVNRVPTHRLADAPACGRCHQPLFDGHPTALTDANYATLVEHTRIPLILDCWAPWCGPCRQFAPVFEQAARQFEPQLRFAKLDTEANPVSASRLDIRSIPTLIAFGGGREIARVSGALSLPQFTAWLRQQGLIASA